MTAAAGFRACGVIFRGRLTSFGLALASFHGFTSLSARVDLMVGHFCPPWHGRDLPPILGSRWIRSKSRTRER
jgi:hypothetical protein